MLHIQIIAVFPEIFEALNYGIPHRAQQKEKITLEVLNLRDFTEDKHKRIDDRPYGGGPGMVLQAAPVSKAINSALQKAPSNTLVSYLSPHGKRFDQTSALQLSQRTHLVFVAGRYEGIDERIYDLYPHEVWSLGDFILSGGEPAIVCMIDAISRLIPEVLGNPTSFQEESFNPDNGLLDYPHYTRPASFNGVSVPSVLLNGNHAEIAHWRRNTSLKRTLKHRPDLLPSANLSAQEKNWLVQPKDFPSQD